MPSTNVKLPGVHELCLRSPTIVDVDWDAGHENVDSSEYIPGNLNNIIRLPPISTLLRDIPSPKSQGDSPTFSTPSCGSPVPSPYFQSSPFSTWRLDAPRSLSVSEESFWQIPTPAHSKRDLSLLQDEISALARTQNYVLEQQLRDNTDLIIAELESFASNDLSSVAVRTTTPPRTTAIPPSRAAFIPSTSVSKPLPILQTTATPSQPAVGVSALSHSLPSPATRKRNNQPYPFQQEAFVIYHRVDLHMSWDQIRTAFLARWPDRERTVGGLECIYYRTNWHVPVTTADGLLVLVDPAEEGLLGPTSEDSRVQGEGGDGKGEDEEAGVGSGQNYHNSQMGGSSTVGYKYYRGVAYRTMHVPVRQGEVPLMERFPEELVDEANDWLRRDVAREMNGSQPSTRGLLSTIVNAMERMF
ncbi:uncharacterized protein CTHT_0023840 [Thermochaetoides thermophila DSM 1495]|uniref:Uncharacterized protein n=1 Tax=Chaetomium thermophilum (strain DSM 1495 / CBS 144.50 / IMI 039719) TaxID=759272 RepID=G0S526_CHATD|nr:hypothetical protein CTHT_0023840 [Thermochaetoides thermophila DSM 1495]EGS20551.1 hypothetical protein CTHT_0023840 [Thermochaetoides thermophila DSM 1495]